MPEKIEKQLPPQGQEIDPLKEIKNPSQEEEVNPLEEIPKYYADLLGRFFEDCDKNEVYKEVVKNRIYDLEYPDKPAVSPAIRVEIELAVLNEMNQLVKEAMVYCEEHWKRVIKISQEMKCPPVLSIKEIERMTYLDIKGIKELRKQYGEDSEEFKSAMDEFQQLSARYAVYKEQGRNARASYSNSMRFFRYQDPTAKPYINSPISNEEIRLGLKQDWENSKGMKFEDYGSVVEREDQENKKE